MAMVNSSTFNFADVFHTMLANYGANISDVMTIVNSIINLTNSVFIWGNADIDENGIINVKDLMDTVILNLIQ